MNEQNREGYRNKRVLEIILKIKRERTIIRDPRIGTS